MKDRNYYEKLNRFKIAVKKKSTNIMQGARKSAAKGSSAEFSDFREYMPGDDIRRIDWNAYGRTERLFIKEYVEERESSISILRDTSASMDYGDPIKSEVAKEIASALSYIVLSGSDHVRIYDLQRIDKPLSLNGGIRAFPRVGDYLDTCQFEGDTDIYMALRKIKRSGSGVTIIISDFMDERLVIGENRTSNLEKIFKLLEYNKQQAVFVHVLDKTEKNPELMGTHNLIDMEDNSSRIRVTMDSKTIDEYKTGFEDFCKSFERTAKKYHASYIKVFTNESMDRILFEDLREIYDI